MTNKLDLFRGLLRTLKQQKPIQVRGEILSLDYYRIAKIVIKDNSSYLLKNTSLVLKFRINLILVRYLYKNKIKGYFNTKNIYFKKDNKILIYIQQNNSLYLIKLILKDYLDRVFSIF